MNKIPFKLAWISDIDSLELTVFSLPHVHAYHDNRELRILEGYQVTNLTREAWHWPIKGVWLMQINNRGTVVTFFVFPWYTFHYAEVCLHSKKHCSVQISRQSSLWLDFCETNETYSKCSQTANWINTNTEKMCFNIPNIWCQCVQLYFYQDTLYVHWKSICVLVSSNSMACLLIYTEFHLIRAAFEGKGFIIWGIKKFMTM